MGNILAITGATGRKSGGAFINELVANIEEVNNKFQGVKIRVLVRNTSNTKTLENKIENLDISRGNFDDEKFLSDAFIDVDTIVHIAGIRFSKKIIDAAEKNKVRRVILVHTTGIYSKYKMAGEEYRKIDSYVYKTCKENRIILTILRPTMIYGNLSDNNVSKFIKMVDTLPIMPVVNGAKYQLQPVHYMDLGKAYYQVLMNEEMTANKDFNLSEGSPIYLREMLRLIGENLDKKVVFLSVPFQIAYIGAIILYILTLKKIDYREKVQRLCEPRIFSYEDAKNAFGYNPRNFEDGIVDEVIQYQTNKNNN